MVLRTKSLQKILTGMSSTSSPLRTKQKKKIAANQYRRLSKSAPCINFDEAVEGGSVEFNVAEQTAFFKSSTPK